MVETTAALRSAKKDIKIYSPDYKSTVSTAKSPSDGMRGEYCLDQEHED